MASKDKVVGLVSEEQIQEWKKKYKDIWEIKIEDESKGLEPKAGYFRKPTRTEMGAATKAGRKDDIRMAEVLIKNMFLGGDEELIHDDDYFMATLDQIDPIVAVAQGSIKKL